MLKTWCADVRACVFFSDEWSAEDDNPVTWRVSAIDAVEGEGEATVPRTRLQSVIGSLDVYEAAQLRFLPALATLRAWIMSL